MNVAIFYHEHHEHCKDSHILIILLRIHKDSFNLMSLDTRSHIFGPRNKIDSLSCLTKFTLHICNVSIDKGYMDMRRGTNISFKMGEERTLKTL